MISSSFLLALPVNIYNQCLAQYLGQMCRKLTKKRTLLDAMAKIQVVDNKPMFTDWVVGCDEDTSQFIRFSEFHMVWCSRDSQKTLAVHECLSVG